MAERFVHAHIRNLPLFEQLSPPQIGVVASIVQVLRFEPGQSREVRLVPLGGKRIVFGFQQKIMGKL